MTAGRFLIALGALLLPAVAVQAAPDPVASSQRDFVLRHYFQGPSETSGWGSQARRAASPDRGRITGPFRPAYYDLQGERHRGDRTRSQLAALDLHVKPARSVVQVGGKSVGLARRYDGIPRWLWLEPGRHRLSFITPEGETVTKTFALKAGSVTQLQAELD